MNCPTCGAQNDADARFCGECGTPLENPDVEATIIGQKFEMPDDFDSDSFDNDMTIMSTSARLVEEAKTMAVDQEAMAAAMEEPDTPEPSLTDSARAAMLPPSPPEADEPVSAGTGGRVPPDSTGEPPSTPPPVTAAAAESGGKSKKILMTVGGIILFIVILCCCCSMAMVGSLLSDPNALEDIMRELGSLGLQNIGLLLV